MSYRDKIRFTLCFVVSAFLRFILLWSFRLRRTCFTSAPALRAPSAKASTTAAVFMFLRGPPSMIKIFFIWLVFLLSCCPVPASTGAATIEAAARSEVLMNSLRSVIAIALNTGDYSEAPSGAPGRSRIASRNSDASATQSGHSRRGFPVPTPLSSLHCVAPLRSWNWVISPFIRPRER